MKAEDGRATSRDRGEGWEEVTGLGLKDMSRNRRDSRFTWKVLAQTEVCARGTVAEGRVGAAAERVFAPVLPGVSAGRSPTRRTDEGCAGGEFTLRG